LQVAHLILIRQTNGIIQRKTSVTLFIDWIALAHVEIVSTLPTLRQSLAHGPITGGCLLAVDAFPGTVNRRFDYETGLDLDRSCSEP
jgi:hypothetical protein